MPAQPRGGVQINSAGANRQKRNRFFGHHGDVHRSAFQPRCPQPGEILFRRLLRLLLLLLESRFAQYLDVAASRHGGRDVGLCQIGYEAQHGLLFLADSVENSVVVLQ